MSSFTPAHDDLQDPLKFNGGRERVAAASRSGQALPAILPNY